MHPIITCVISFCTNDFRFLKACIEGVRPFSQTIIVSVCDHFFDGSEENFALLEEAYRLFPDCLFIEYAFEKDSTYRTFTPLYPEHPNWRHEWHNTGRWIAYHFLPREGEVVLFIDCDEIVQAGSCMQWMEIVNLREYTAVRVAAYWHFREARFESEGFYDTGLFVRQDALSSELLWHADERAGLLRDLPEKKMCGVVGVDGLPFMRHYSWVRTEAEVWKKINSWGHHLERSWKEIMQEEWAHPFNGVDCVRKYHYRDITPSFDPLVVPVPALSPIDYTEHLTHLRLFPHVIRVDKNEMRRREIHAWSCD